MWASRGTFDRSGGATAVKVGDVGGRSLRAVPIPTFFYTVSSLLDRHITKSTSKILITTMRNRSVNNRFFVFLRAFVQPAHSQPPPHTNNVTVGQEEKVVNPWLMPMKFKQYLLPRLPGIVLTTADPKKRALMTF